MTEQEEIQIQRRVTKLGELLRESLEHFGERTFDSTGCPECRQSKSGSMTRCDRCFREAVQSVLGIKPRPF